MAVVTIATLKTYFETGDFPTQAQFIDLIDTLGVATQWTTKTQITATQNNYAIGTGKNFRMSSDADRSVTGIVAGIDGQEITIANIGSNQISFLDQSNSSDAANRIIIDNASGTLDVAADGIVTFRYDGTTARWRYVSSVSNGKTSIS